MSGLDDGAYDDAATVLARIAQGRHREVIGGMWDEIGALQRDFLMARGLQPGHRLLDIGCGALRGGVTLIPYLDPGNYWGIDKHRALLDIGWVAELAPLGLTVRQPRAQLVALADFEFAQLGVRFDYAIAQSVFTHLPLNRLRRCLARLAPCMADGGVFYASFFEIAPGQDREAPHVHQPGGMTSHSDRSFYHYDLDDFVFAAKRLPWIVNRIGGWGHPRGQSMVEFRRAPD